MLSVRFAIADEWLLWPKLRYMDENDTLLGNGTDDLFVVETIKDIPRKW